VRCCVYSCVRCSAVLIVVVVWQYGASAGLVSVGKSARCLVGLGLYIYWHEACQVRRHNGMRLIRFVGQ